MANSSVTAMMEKPVFINGVNIDQVTGVISEIEADVAYAATQFRVKNKWIDGGLNRSQIKGFYACRAEDTTRTETFTLEADEPEFLAGDDSAPNPVEYVLHALAGCLTTTLVYHASVRDIGIEAIETELEGDLDLRGILGLSDRVRKGYHHVRVTMRVKSDANVEELEGLAMFSPVYDMISNSLPVDFRIEKIEQ